MKATLIFVALIALAAAESAFTQAEKDFLVKRHNEVRGEMKPKGADLLLMTWDDDIANNAQKYAEECSSEHSSDASRPGMGENLAWGWPLSNASEAMKSWVENERPFWTYETQECADEAPHGCGHYTQVVLATADKIGCGYVKCDTIDPKFTADGEGINIVCQYSAAQGDAHPYLEGKPCSKCSGKCNEEFGLCEKVTTCQDGFVHVTGATQPDLNGFFEEKEGVWNQNNAIYLYQDGDKWIMDNDKDSTAYYAYTTSADPFSGAWKELEDGAFVDNADLVVKKCGEGGEGGSGEAAASGEASGEGGYGGGYASGEGGYGGGYDYYGEGSY